MTTPEKIEMKNKILAGCQAIKRFIHKDL